MTIANVIDALKADASKTRAIIPRSAAISVHVEEHVDGTAICIGPEGPISIGLYLQPNGRRMWTHNGDRILEGESEGHAQEGSAGRHLQHGRRLRGDHGEGPDPARHLPSPSEAHY